MKWFVWSVNDIIDKHIEISILFVKSHFVPPPPKKSHPLFIEVYLHEMLNHAYGT